MFPGDLEDQLEFLHEAALELGRRTRARRNWGGLNPEDELAKDVQQFFVRVREKDDLIGVHRGTRILRFDADPVFGLDPSAQRGTVENAAEWIDLVVSNIETIIDVIDRKRAMWFTFAGTILAAIAVGVGIIAIAVSLFLRF